MNILSYTYAWLVDVSDGLLTTKSIPQWFWLTAPGTAECMPAADFLPAVDQQLTHISLYIYIDRLSLVNSSIITMIMIKTI